MKDLDFFTPGARLALELECLLLDTRNDAAQSRWWDLAHEALEQWRQAVRAMEASIDAVQPEASTTLEQADEVVFIDGVGAGRNSVKSCRDGVQWIVVGDRVYWPLSDSDAKRLQSACCGNGSFDGPATPAMRNPTEASTTLEQAALQSLVDPEEVLELDGLSDSDWRERIGNAVPPDAARHCRKWIAALRDMRMEK